MIAHWLDIAVRPDLAVSPVQRQSASSHGESTAADQSIAAGPERRRPALQGTPPLVTPALQTLLASEGPASPAQMRALQALDGSGLSGPWANLSWDKVQYEAAQRIFHPEAINQRLLNACGPAAIANVTADTNPERYAQLVIEVFTKGEVRGVKCTKALLDGSVPAGMAQVDWMFLSALRNSQHNSLGRFEGKTTDEASGVAWPVEMQVWLKEIAGKKDAEIHTSYLWGTRSNTEKVNQLLTSHPGEVVVLMLVRAGGLSNESKKASKKADGKAAAVPNHWIRLRAPVQFKDGKAILDVFTWGANSQYTIDEKTFDAMTYTFIVGASKDGIL